MKNRNIFKRPATGLLLLAGAAFTTAHANDVDYNYLEARYIFDADVESVDGDGFELAGSFRIDKDFYAFGRFTTLDFDQNIDTDQFEIGAGYIYPINQKWDANFTFSFVNIDTSTPVISSDDNGFAISAGVRGMMTQKIEGRAAVTYIDVDGNDTFITLGGDYMIKPNLSIGLEADLAGDLDTLSIGARYYF